jgi:anti-sigma B factor antagonist
MAFKLTTRNLGEVTVIDLSGRLELGQGSVALRETLQNISTRGAKVLINLTDVAFIDTSGLGELVSGHTRAQHVGTCLKLTGIPKRVEKLFQMTGLDRILEIYDNEADAIHSWGENPFPSDSLLSETVA